jgi:hypothetical protein
MRRRSLVAALVITSLGASHAATAAADRIGGQVAGGGDAIAQSEVTLWAAGRSGPRKLAEAVTGADDRFELSAQSNAGGEVLYLVAKGGEPAASARKGRNDAIALMAIAASKTSNAAAT